MPRPANRRGPLSASARFVPPPRLEMAISGGVHVVGRPHQAVALPPRPRALAPMRRRRLKLKSRGTRRLAGPSPQATAGRALFFHSQLVRLRRCVCSRVSSSRFKSRGRGTSRRTLPLERSSSAWPKIPGLRPLFTLAPRSGDFDWRIAATRGRTVPATQEGRRHGAVSPRSRPQPTRGFVRAGRRL